MSEEPKTITITIEQLVAFVEHIEASTDYDGCLHGTPQQMIAEFFGVEVPPKPAPPKRVENPRPFTPEENAVFTKLMVGFTDEMALSRLVKR